MEEEKETPDQSGITVNNIVRELYGPIIAEQLGLPIDITSFTSSPHPNEVVVCETENFGSGAYAVATRRVDWDNNTWHVDVNFGDSGYEVDPGVYSESPDKALDMVERTIMALGEIRQWLKELE